MIVAAVDVDQLADHVAGGARGAGAHFEAHFRQLGRGVRRGGDTVEAGPGFLARFEPKPHEIEEVEDAARAFLAELEQKWEMFTTKIAA